MTCVQEIVDDRLLRARLRADGYAYIDDHGVHVPTRPETGWLVTLGETGEPISLALDTDPFGDVRVRPPLITGDH